MITASLVQLKSKTVQKHALYVYKSNSIVIFLANSLQRLLISFKGRFLPIRRYHNFANSFSKLSESTLYKEISKFQ